MDHLSGTYLPVLAEKEDIRTVIHVHESVSRVVVAFAGSVD